MKGDNIIKVGGGAAKMKERKAEMYQALRVYYQKLDEMPEPYRKESLTAVRGVLFYLEAIQNQLSEIYENLKM